MQAGDKVRLKDGNEATITGFGMGDFIGDPFPVYLITTSGKVVTLMSSAFEGERSEVTARKGKPRKE